MKPSMVWMLELWQLLSSLQMLRSTAILPLSDLNSVCAGGVGVYLCGGRHFLIRTFSLSNTLLSLMIWQSLSVLPFKASSKAGYPLRFLPRNLPWEVEASSKDGDGWEGTHSYSYLIWDDVFNWFANAPRCHERNRENKYADTSKSLPGCGVTIAT